MKRLILIGYFFLFVLSASAAEDIIIADFESRDYGRWKTEGEAFGKGPVSGTLKEQMEVSGYEGRRYVNSFHGGDNSTGTLTSPTFKIEGDYINFLIGGGGFKGETCINLLVQGAAVRTATGPNTEEDGSEILDCQSWDVREFKDQNAQIQIVDKRKGGWGHILVDQIVQGDQKVEMIENVARQFTFGKKYLNIPVKNGSPLRLIDVLINDEIIREFEINLAPNEPDFWVYLELDPLKGQTATIRIDKLNANKRRGFDSIFQADTFPGEDSLYNEKHRPQFHFSSKRGWNNDPNGLMYYAGEYHMFYQHNPFGWAWGNMTWGHAVSKDLVHWQELGDALYPDKLGTMFSGSGVVDWQNTTGFQTGAEPPLITIFTNAGSVNPWSEGKPFTQGIAYSNDRGRSWTKYKGNPVQGHINEGNRDPKVIWWEKTHEWVIVLYLKEHRMAFFRSADLKRWELQSILQSFHECPELFQLPVDGDQNNKKWILYGAAGDYFIGDFDGSKLTTEGEAIKYNYGDAFYASQTFNDIPKEDGRRIQIGWGQVATPGMPFNQMMNFPVELTLRTTDQGMHMCANPVREIELLYKKTHRFTDTNLAVGNNPLSGIKGDLFDIQSEFEVGAAKQIGFEIRGVPVIYNAEKDTLSCKEKTAPCRPIDGKIKLRLLVDRTSIEIFINDGLYYMPMGSIPADENKSINFFAKGGTAKIISLEVNELKSAWH
jgi:fructan beta-fructosidase